MAVTRKVEGWGTTTAIRVVMDACDRVGVGLIMLSAIGIVVKSKPDELTGWLALMSAGLVFAFVGGYAKHWVEALLEEEQRLLDAKEARETLEAQEAQEDREVLAILEARQAQNP